MIRLLKPVRLARFANTSRPLHQFRSLNHLAPIRAANRAKTITILSTAGVLIATTFIYNDRELIRNDFKQLKPELNADTYENGLFIESQKETEDELNLYREKRINYRVIGYFYKIGFMINDFVIEPIITIGRFCQLTLIFLPIVLTIPISWLGRRNHNIHNETSGTILWYKIIRYSLESAGASFIKLGQWAASRTDIFPQQLCDELGNLHSNAKQHSLKYTKRVLSESFGGLPFEQIFEEFNENPVGVGAIAQVYIGVISSKIIENIDEFLPEHRKKTKGFFHRTILSNDASSKQSQLQLNQKVAIKVMHPNVEKTIKRDLKIMRFFANLLNMIPTAEWLSLPDEVNNFDVLMNLQLDLRIEGLNLKKFQKNFENHLFINFPKSYMKFSNKHVLFEEYIDGLSMSKVLELKNSKKLNNKMSKLISDETINSFLQMLILNNFIHSDLHAGNIFIRFVKTNELETEIVSSPAERDAKSEYLKQNVSDLDVLSTKLNELSEEGYKPEICFIDAGLVTELNIKNRRNFIALFSALAEFDGYKAGELMIERSKTPETAIDKELFALKVEKLVDKIKQRTFTLGTVSIGDLLEKMMTMVRSHHVRMEGDFVSVIVAILLLEGLGRQLDPNMDLFARFVYFAIVEGVPEAPALAPTLATGVPVAAAAAASAPALLQQ